MLCCGSVSLGEGLYQVLETVESGFLATDDDNTGDVKPAAADTHIAAGICVICFIWINSLW